jgi:DNA replication protein DnaC
MSADMLNAMVMGIFIQIVGGSLSDLIKTIISCVKNVFGKIYDHVGPRWNSVKTSYVSVVMKNGASLCLDGYTYRDESIMTAMAKFISDNNICKKTAKLKTLHYDKSALIVTPDVGNEIEYDGYYVTFEHTTADQTGERVKVTQTMTVRSKKSVIDIKKWITSIYDVWRVSQEKEKKISGYVLRHIRGDIDAKNLSFDKYRSKADVNFDNLYFEEKEDIMKLVNKFKKGEMKKMSLLLHGKPGCGKTSTIHAIANELDAIVIELKLSYITSDTQLQRAFNSEGFMCDDGGAVYSEIPFEKRIYLLEEIDAESDIVKQRHSDAESKRGSDENADTDKKRKKMVKLNKMFAKYGGGGVSLAGVLDALDGIVKLNSMVIVTTNYLKDLDDALTRPGRMDACIELKYMRSIDADKMIKSKFPDFGLRLDDYVISPAMLESFMVVSDNAADLERRVKKYLATL